MAEAGETPEELGRRVADLYRELSFPSEAKFRAALRRRGIKVSAEFVRELVADQSSRQLTAPAPRYTGHVTSRKPDHVWAADLMDFIAKSTKGSPAHVLVVQDIFSRFLFARALRSKAETEAAFLRIMQESGRKCEELSTDKGSEFTSTSFQARMRERQILHRFKTAPQDLATLDRAIGILRSTLSRRTAESGNPWYEELDAAVKSINNTENAGIFGEEPADVSKDDDLNFDLRYRNAEQEQENLEQAVKRGERLQKLGAFRTLLPIKGFRRRQGAQNWSEKIHTVANVSATSGTVEDTDGETFKMSMVKPVTSTTVPIAASSFQQAGDTRVNERRFRAFFPWRSDIIEAIRSAGDTGILTTALGRYVLADKPGFQQALKEQKATLKQVLELFPEIRTVKEGAQTRLFLPRQRPRWRQGVIQPP